MTRLWATVLAAGLLIGRPGLTGAQDLAGLDLPLLVNIRSAPIPVRADGKFRLVYELHLTNTDKKPVTLHRVEVWSTAKLATIDVMSFQRPSKPPRQTQRRPSPSLQAHTSSS